jgi:hypothetical protein
MNYSIYPRINEYYVSLLTLAKRDYDSAAPDTANEQMARYLYAEYKGGTNNIIAQTRIAASYGLLQILYSTAVDEENYSEQALPEELNVTDIGMRISMQRQKRLLQERLRLNGSDETENDWSIGYDQAFLAHVYHLWNPRSGYTVEVLQFSRVYQPR